MKSLKAWLKNIGIFLILFVLASLYLVYFPYIHQRHVVGPVKGVKQIFDAAAIVSTTGADPSSKIYSFAVAVQDTHSSEIVTGSTEDRQWGVVKEGQCVEATFFPYPPWNLQKSGTYYNVRFKKLFDNCTDLDSKK
jgi:hypothetical protein